MSYGMQVEKDIADLRKKITVPLGAVIYFVDTVAIPEGYVKADGTVVNSEDYPELGRMYGVLSGTFALPSLANPAGLISLVRVR